jgi:hypothetical protein
MRLVDGMQVRQQKRGVLTYGGNGGQVAYSTVRCLNHRRSLIRTMRDGYIAGQMGALASDFKPAPRPTVPQPCVP